jgi:hypothetical protein
MVAASLRAVGSYAHGFMAENHHRVLAHTGEADS